MTLPDPVLEKPHPVAVARLKGRLREHRRFRQNQLRDMLDCPLRQRRTVAQIEVQAELTTAAVRVLADIEIALSRIDSGQYGDCLRCGDAIGLVRLRIVPHTRYCARCHRAEEIGAPR
jgi:RNA polymerase-binding transcription factor DksA